MDTLDLARWQFGVTTVYHFIFVPLTIGLAPLVAIMQTMWHRSGDDKWLKLTNFFGKLFLINFILGVVTGIVQEFQFGMNWSEYSRFVGDVFGAPLAFEALAAFFVESTFLGLWIFGWDKLPKKIHLATIWLVALSVNLSAFFIIAANSWMQHPVGAAFNPETGRAEMTSFGEILTNNTLWAAFPHTVTGAFLVAGTFVAGVSAWWMVRLARKGQVETANKVYRPAMVLGIITIFASGIGVIATGDFQAKIMFEQQPMKMAAAEGMCETEQGAAFSILSIGDFTNDCENVTRIISVTGLTSFLATNDFNAELKGVTQLQAEYQELYGTTDSYGNEVNYVPDLFVTYWSFRLMMGLGFGAIGMGLLALWVTRKGHIPVGKWFSRIALWVIPMPFLANSFGWIFTEMGRQPWVVHPKPTNVPGQIDHVWMLTADGVSQVVNVGPVVTSLVGFTLVYGFLAVLWYRLMVRYAKQGASSVPIVKSLSKDEDDSAPMSFAY